LPWQTKIAYVLRKTKIYRLYMYVYIHIREIQIGLHIVCVHIVCLFMVTSTSLHLTL